MSSSPNSSSSNKTRSRRSIVVLTLVVAAFALFYLLSGGSSADKNSGGGSSLRGGGAPSSDNLLLPIATPAPPPDIVGVDGEPETPAPTVVAVDNATTANETTPPMTTPAAAADLDVVAPVVRPTEPRSHTVAFYQSVCNSNFHHGTYWNYTFSECLPIEGFVGVPVSPVSSILLDFEVSPDELSCMVRKEEVVKSTTTSTTSTTTTTTTTTIPTTTTTLAETVNNISAANFTATATAAADDEVATGETQQDVKEDDNDAEEDLPPAPSPRWLKFAFRAPGVADKYLPHKEKFGNYFRFQIQTSWLLRQFLPWTPQIELKSKRSRNKKSSSSIRFFSARHDPAFEHLYRLQNFCVSPYHGLFGFWKRKKQHQISSSNNSQQQQQQPFSTADDNPSWEPYRGRDDTYNLRHGEPQWGRFFHRVANLLPENFSTTSSQPAAVDPFAALPFNAAEGLDKDTRRNILEAAFHSPKRQRHQQQQREIFDRRRVLFLPAMPMSRSNIGHTGNKLLSAVGILDKFLGHSAVDDAANESSKPLIVFVLHDDAFDQDQQQQQQKQQKQQEDNTPSPQSDDDTAASPVMTDDDIMNHPGGRNSFLTGASSKLRKHTNAWGMFLAALDVPYAVTLSTSLSAISGDAETVARTAARLRQMFHAVEHGHPTGLPAWEDLAGSAGVPPTSLVCFREGFAYQNCLDCTSSSTDDSSSTASSFSFGNFVTLTPPRRKLMDLWIRSVERCLPPRIVRLKVEDKMRDWRTTVHHSTIKHVLLAQKRLRARRGRTRSGAAVDDDDEDEEQQDPAATTTTGAAAVAPLRPTLPLPTSTTSVILHDSIAQSLPRIFFHVRSFHRGIKNFASIIDILHRDLVLAGFASSLMFREPFRSGRAQYLQDLRDSDVFIGTHSGAFAEVIHMRRLFVASSSGGGGGSSNSSSSSPPPLGHPVVVEIAAPWSACSHDTAPATGARCWFAPFTSYVAADHWLYQVPRFEAKRHTEFHLSSAFLVRTLREAACRWLNVHGLLALQPWCRKSARYLKRTSKSPPVEIRTMFKKKIVQAKSAAAVAAAGDRAKSNSLLQRYKQQSVPAGDSVDSNKNSVPLYDQPDLFSPAPPVALSPSSSSTTAAAPVLRKRLGAKGVLALVVGLAAVTVFLVMNGDRLCRRRKKANDGVEEDSEDSD